MLRLLLLLSVAIALSGADEQVITSNSDFDISSCPITYFGQKYERVYVNVTSENVVICFNGYYDPQNKGDCLVRPGAVRIEFHIFGKYPYIENLFRQDLPSISNALECFLGFSDYLVLFWVANFGSQAALLESFGSEGTALTDVLVDGNKVNTVNVTNAADNFTFHGFADLSGCRHSGVLLRPGEVSSDPETCFSLNCSQTAVLQTSTCGPLERCQGNGICSSDSLLDTICTVTGPAVIDFHGQQNSVKDRCSYSLLRIPSVPDFQVLANFQERHRKDVSFLDSVMLRLNGSGIHIYLKQGGRVLLDDSALTLNSSVQTVRGVKLSKDQTGVTAKVSLSNFKASVFFDGSTAQIHLEGPAGQSLQGLCGNSSRSLSKERVSEDSSTSCEMQYKDSNETTINCTKMTERCNLLKEAPFSSCDIDPEPYISACIDTLCSYSDLDHLRCQFLEAYARACSLKSNTTLEDWRSKADCSPPGAFCQDRTCSDHEFCGEKTAGGETRCFCRAIFASKYRKINSLGDPPVCSENSASLSLVGCLLEDKGIDHSVLQLKEPTCRGQIDKQTHMVTFSFNSANLCGMEITNNNSQVIYKNTIMSQNLFSGGITRQDQVYIDFSCIQTQPDIQTAIFRSSVVQVISSGPWRYSLTMKAYTDPGRTQAVYSNTEVRLNQKIWVELDTDGLDEKLVAVVTDSCWATDQASPTGGRKYYLIKNGCPNSEDQTVTVEGNGEGTSNYFSFNMFQFTGSSAELYLHCKLQLCVKQENSCVKNCDGARKRRFARSNYEAAAFISMAWTT
ncbi:alpha-tectorin-like isoform X1 [Girardinichthys multiradiatus]|uniref:alpha-tectorin-like isoform X1 n=1 Tax=Girardinichthys multiradiatus TaxID=208333 RepID=UPI001FACC351|nr:alpha-tectorin-like isoform X1 [Girardinichthys multiradiatus]